MVTFMLIVLACIVVGLIISCISLSNRLIELEGITLQNLENLGGSLSKEFGDKLDRKDLFVKHSLDVNAQAFELIAKQLGKEFKKTRVIETDRFGNEKIVSKFELVNLQKVKKTKWYD